MLYCTALSALMFISSSHAQKSITAQCSGILDPSIGAKDLIANPEAHGPDFMRGMFCSFYKETPSGSPYSLCSDSESSDCTRTENRNSWSVTGTRDMSPFQQSVCSAGFVSYCRRCVKQVAQYVTTANHRAISSSPASKRASRKGHSAMMAHPISSQWKSSRTKILHWHPHAR